MAVVALHRSLSARLLVLTMAFVLLGEVLICVPSIARFRRVYLEERIAAAHLATLSLEAAASGPARPNPRAGAAQPGGGAVGDAARAGGGAVLGKLRRSRAGLRSAPRGPRGHDAGRWTWRSRKAATGPSA